MHLIRAPEDVVKLFGEERLSRFGLLGHRPHFAQEIGQRDLLAGHLLNQRLPLRGSVQRLLRRIVQPIQVARNLALLVRHVARLVPHSPHLLGELAGGLLPQVFTQGLQVLLRARAGRQCFGNRLPFKFLRGPLHIGAGLLQLLPGTGLPRGVGRLLQPLAQLVNVGQQLSFLVPEALELPLNLFACLLGACLL